MRKTRYLKHIGKILGLRFDEHLADKRSAELGQRKRACFTVNILSRYSERLGRGQKLIKLWVAHIGIHNRNARHILKMLIECRHIVTEIIKLQNRVMKRMEVKVSGSVNRIRIIGGVLNWREILGVHIRRHNNHAARVLTRCALNADAALNKALLLGS